MLGDRQVDLEGPVAATAIFAVVAEVNRNGRWIPVEAHRWKVAGDLWRMLYPVRKLAFAAKRAIRK